MPIYEYECGKCGEIFEVFQKASDPPPTKHSCGGRKITRVMSRTSFILKGDGWYVTDYARKEQKAKDKAKKTKGHKVKTDTKDAAGKNNASAA